VVKEQGQTWAPTNPVAQAPHQSITGQQALQQGWLSCVHVQASRSVHTKYPEGIFPILVFTVMDNFLFIFV
jgi:hypothetical protein